MVILSSNKRPSQIIAWLGFGISLVFLLLIWTVNILVFAQGNQSETPVMTLYLATIILGCFLGLLGLVFSIIGLVLSYKYNLKKLPGVLGIIFCFTSLISACVPMFYSFYIKTEELKISLPQSVEDDNSIEIQEVVISIGENGNVKCYIEESKDTTNMSASSVSGFQKELNDWLLINNYDENVSIIIKSDDKAGYGHLINVLDAVSNLKIKNYYIK